MKNNFEKVTFGVNQQKKLEVSDEAKKSRILAKFKKIGLASLISLASFGTQAQNKELNKQEILLSKENKDSVYPRDIYNPASENFNPLKVYKDLALEFHPEKIDSVNISISGGELSPLMKEMKKINALSALDFDVDPALYTDKEMFIKDFIQKRGPYLSQPGVKEEFELHDAYFKGKASLYDSLLKKYRTDFKKFKADKPIHALTVNFSDFDAGLAYNHKTEGADFNYDNEEDFKDVIELWQKNAEDGMPNGDKIRDYEWQKTHLAEEALARWNAVHESDQLPKMQSGLN